MLNEQCMSKDMWGSVDMRSSRILFVTALVAGVGFNSFATDIVQQTKKVEASGDLKKDGDVVIKATVPNKVGIEFISGQEVNIFTPDGKMESDEDKVSAKFKISGTSRNVKLSFSGSDSFVCDGLNWHLKHTTDKNTEVYVPVSVSFGNGSEKQKNDTNDTNDINVTTNEILVERKSKDAEYKIKVNAMEDADSIFGSGEFKGTLTASVAPAV